MSLRLLSVFLTKWAIFSSSTSKSFAADIIDNTLGSAATLGLPTASSALSSSRGYAFTVGNFGISLDTITFGLYANNSGTSNVGVRLYAGSGASGSPVADTGTSLLTMNLIGSALYYDFNVSWTLSPNTTYSIMLYGSGNSATPRLAVTSQAIVTDASVTGIGFYVNTSTTTENYAVRFQGTPVPEPSTYVLGGIAMACVAAMASKRSLSRGIA